MKKVLLILGIVAFNLCAFAIESDFKNSLLKVDYAKTGTDSYAIRLFTQKPYSEPIKVIKKTNTSYYILLPETFHSIGSVAPTGDIKSTEVKLFPYAGQDLNNGYTKISIFTSKPLNITAQLNSSSGAVAPSIDPKKLSQLDSAFNTKQAQANEAQRQAQYAALQKQIQEQKRIAAQQEAQRQAQLKAQQEAQRQAQIKAQQEAQRQAQIKAQQEAQARAQAQREARLRAQQEAQTKAKSQQEAQRQAQIKAQQAREAAQKSQQETQRQAQIKAQQKQDTGNLQVLDNAGTEKGGADLKEKKFGMESGNGTPEETKNNSDEQNIITQDIVNNPEIEKTVSKIPEASGKLDNIANIKEIIKDRLKPLVIKLRPYYYIIKDNLILFSALFIAFVGILILFAINRRGKKKESVKTMEQKEDTVNEIPNTTQENTEKSDEISFKEEFNELTLDKENETVEPYNNNENEEYAEPQVLSSVEIASNRGFMIIEQQGIKALFGYIHDDVFLLYQFKEFLSDTQIKFRISEKQENRTFFIVKVDKFKLLVRATNTHMKLELEM